MAKRLRGLKISKVSLCTTPANPGANVTIWKSDDVEACAECMPDDLSKAVLTADIRNSLPSASFAFVGADGKGHLPIHDAAHVRNALARFNQTHFDSPAQKEAARRKIEAKAKALGVDVGKMDPTISDVHQPTNMNSGAGMHKCAQCGKMYRGTGTLCPACDDSGDTRGPTRKTGREEEDMPQIDKSALSPEVVAHIEGLEARATDVETKLTKAEADLADANGKLAEVAKTADPEAELIAKAAPELRSLIEKAQTAAREAQAAVLVEKREREKGVLIAKFGVELAQLPGITPAELAEVYLNLDSATVEKLHPVLQAASAAIEAGKLFEETGRSGVRKASTVMGEIETAAQALIAKSATPLSLVEAKDQVLMANPALYDRYLAEGSK